MDTLERRIVVTGMGLAVPAGLSVDGVWRCWRQGESAIAASNKLDPLAGFSAPLACVPSFDLAKSLKTPKNEKFMAPSVRFAMHAAKDAVAAAALDLSRFDPYRVSLYTGSGQTGLESTEFFRTLEAGGGTDEASDFANMGGRASRAIDRYFSLRTLSNAGLGLLSMEFGAQGPSNNFVQDDTASVLAIAAGARDLEEGLADVAIVGGYDSLHQTSAYLAYRHAGVASTSCDSALRPFDASSDGVALGEGAGFLVLERADDASRRGAPIAGVLHGIGFGVQTEDNGATKTSARGMQAAIAEATGGHRIDGAIAHGIGLPEADANEARILEATLDRTVPVTAVKGLTGYLGAATGAVEFVLALTAAREGTLPPVVRRRTGGPASLVVDAERALGPQPLVLSLTWSWLGRCAALAAVPWRSQ